jgi:hypothetical protein
MYYLLTAHGAIADLGANVIFGNIREALQFNSFEQADSFAKSVPAIRAEWYHIVCDALPTGTVTAN